MNIMNRISQCASAVNSFCKPREIASGKLFSFFTCPSDRRSFMLLFHVKSTYARCLRSSLARRTGAITVSEKFCKRENLV